MLFLKKIAHEFTGYLHKNRTKFSENSRAIFFEKRLHYCTTMHLKNPAKNLRIAELRLLRNPPLIWNQLTKVSLNQVSNLRQQKKSSKLFPNVIFWIHSRFTVSVLS